MIFRISKKIEIKKRDLFRRTLVLLACLVLAHGLAISSWSLADSVGSFTATGNESAPIRYVHSAAGFEVTVPAGWPLQVSSTGLEAEQENALLAVDFLPYPHGTAAEILALASGSDTAQENEISSPAPGLRASLKEQDYAAELAVLKTPVGFYLVSLEQTGAADPAASATFDSFLGSFKPLGSIPFDYAQPGMEYAELGPVEVSLPPGSLTIQPGSLLWKSSAGGILGAEIVGKGKNDELTALIEGWEAAMLGSETGLKQRTSRTELRLDGRRSVRADYGGEGVGAAVIVTEIDTRKALLLTLVAKPASMPSHRPLLDAACFSLTPTGGGEIYLAAEEEHTPAAASQGELAASSSSGSRSVGSGSSAGLSNSDRKLYSQLRSKDPGEVRYAAKHLYSGRYQSKSLFDTAAEVLKAGYRREPNNTHIDAMAWICKALGESGNKKYRTLLQEVADKAPSRKLKGYAEKSARQLP